MKLATLEHGSRDRSLAAVSRDLSSAIVVETPLFRLKTLQQLVANDDSTQPKATQICAGQNKPPKVDRWVPPPAPLACTAALPRVYQWADRPVKCGNRLSSDAGGSAGPIFGAMEHQVVGYVG